MAEIGIFFRPIKLKNYNNFDCKSGKLTLQIKEGYYKNEETLKSEKFKIIFVEISTGMVDKG